MFKGFFLIIVLVCSFLFAPNLVLAQTSNAYEKLGMSSVCLNAKTGKIISGENQNQVLPLASLTKLMTAQVLLDLKLNFQKLITISDGQMNYVNAYIDKGDITSKINMQTGDKVMAKDLWHAMLIASSNEAAIALVDSSGIGRAKFVEKMNKKAKVFGLRNTKFTEPSGIDPNNLGTASDMAIIANKAFKNSLIRDVSAKTSYSFKDLISGRKISAYNRNTSLLAMNPSGMKVGYLTEAKNNVALKLLKAGNDRIVVVLHALNNARRNKEIARLMGE